MHVDLTPEQRALQQELREYFAALMTPERRASLTGGEAGGEGYREIVRQMGKDGRLALDEGALNPADASAMKVMGTEQLWRCLRLLMEVVGSVGYLPKGSPGAVLEGQLEQSFRHAPVGTFGGGVNEVQREIIGMAGLGLPRAPR